jgi:hypothetical protein
VRQTALKAIAKLNEVLDIDPKQVAPEQYVSMIRTQAVAAVKALELQMRADEGSMRAREFDAFSEVMQRFREEDAIRPLKQLDLEPDEELPS